MPRIPAFARRILVALIMVAVAACAQGTPEPQAEQAALSLGAELHWPEVAGAIEYRVQVWDGVRLLFEEVREQTALSVTPVMERSMLGVESAELQVRAIGPDGRQIGEVYRQSFGAAES